MSSAHSGDRRRCLSVVVPVYYNALNLPQTVPKLLALADELDDLELELVFVNDGSGDSSLEQLIEWQRREPQRIVVVSLSRNFGAMAAVLAGIVQARGDCIGVISADLQDPPELLLQMAAHWRNGSQVVLAVRAAREDSLVQRLFSGAYYALLRRFALPGYPKGGFDYCVFGRQVADELIRIGEKNTNLGSLVFWMGFSPVMIPYTRQARRDGRSRWSVAKRVKLFVDSFVAFSYVPIRAASVVGGVVAFAAFVYAAWVAAVRLLYGLPIPGFASVVVAVSFFSGLQMLMLGVLGEYLWRTLDEVRRRPQYLVDRVWCERPSPIAARYADTDPVPMPARRST